MEHFFLTNNRWAPFLYGSKNLKPFKYGAFYIKNKEAKNSTHYVSFIHEKSHGLRLQSGNLIF